MNFGLFSEMSNPYFSIIIPTYNSGNILIDCLESIFQQTYTDFEVWIIDGCSNDHTIEIAKTFQKKYQQLNILSEIDAGIYDAMNKGIDLAKGEWLYFIGSDDTVMSNDVLDNVFKSIQMNEYDFFYGNVKFRNKNIIYGQKFDINKLLFQKNICHQSIFYKRSLFSKVGLFNIKYPLWADWDFNIRCFKNDTIKIGYDEIIVANYNDLTGKSSLEFDNVFQKELPLHYVTEILTLQNKINYYNQYLRNNKFKSIIKILLGEKLF